MTGRSVDQVADDLRRLGVAQGGVLMVHVSLRAVGPVAQGAAGLVSALEQAIGAAGTLLVNVGAAQTPRVPFEASTTPADPDNGVFAEVFRTLPGTVVSDHPDGRFAARGAGAEALVADQPWDDYYGPGSPLHRLVEVGGQVLRLGADVDTVTLLHYAEYLTPVPDKRRVRREHLLHAPDGGVRRAVLTCLDDCDGIVEWPGEDYFGLILADYLATGRARTAAVGAARSELLDAHDLVEFASIWMAERFDRPGE